MILGMSTATYTFLHVVISLIAIGSGIFVMWDLLKGKSPNILTSVFLITTALTSISGFGFPFEHLLPSHKVGIISLAVLAITIPARYVFHLSKSWRWVYVVGAALVLYFNVFVLVVQAFLKVPALKALAPTQTEAPFLAAQVVVLLAFLALTLVATVRFHPERVRMA